MSFLSLLIIIISADSWIWRVWALVRSTRPKNSLDTTSKSTIVRERLMLRLMPCLASFKEARSRKRLSEMRIPRSSFANLTNKGKYRRSQSFEPSLGSKAFPATPGPHLRDSHPATIVPILDPASRQASLRRALLGQHWRPEAAATRSAGERPRDSKGERIRPERWLERKRG